MKILCIGQCDADYLEKCHEAFKTGLRRLFDVKLFGIGYSNYNPELKTYKEIIDHLYQGDKPDFIITHFDMTTQNVNLPYEGLKDIDIQKAIILGDFWNITENYKDKFIDFLDYNKIDKVLCYFPNLLEIYPNVKNKFIFIPASIDPMIFNDYNMVKKYVVGFLCAGMFEQYEFYPERYKIHQKLLRFKNYFYANHPGWNRQTNHPLIGAGYSKTINSCKMFVNTCGRYKCPNSKYFSILASKTTLLAEEPLKAAELHLIDMETYIKITPDTIVDIIEFCLKNPDKATEIAKNGYEVAMKYHTCYARANDFYQEIKNA